MKLKRKNLKRIKCLNDTQENVNIRLMMKTIWDLKAEFNKEIEPLNGTQAEKKKGLKNLIVQLENSKEGPTS